MPHPRQLSCVVLVVDDDESFLALARKILESRFGYTVHAAQNGKQALQTLERATVDVVLTDIFMPDMDGIELLLHIRQEHEVKGVIAVSGGGSTVDKDFLTSARLLGANSMLCKPLDWDRLHSLIQSLCAGHA